ncbi:SH3 and multiple ankyrin repeat domains protein 2 [Geranomyces variabilis]|nr:SH3 and multiple ankyrin repeat domains protein 2 [Geranomyces variabilis]
MSTPTAPNPASPAAPDDKGTGLVLRISLPSQEWSKAIKVYTRETIWEIKRRIVEKMASGIEDALNYGLFIPADPKSGKQGRFLDEKREIGTVISENSTLIEFVPKYRVVTTTSAADTDGGSPSLNSKKKQKKFVEDVTKGNVDKIRERGSKGFDPNFYNENGDTPLTLAVMNNDRETITALLEGGALLDYRLGKKDGWKTALHVAAANNKVLALQTLIAHGAWVNCPDGANLPALYYATQNSHPECVLRLLLARSNPDATDDTGKAPLHLACYSNHEAIASLLIDCGASMNAPNAAGNTPLHVAATRNAKECAKWLVLRGCEREKPNLSGQTAAQLAALSGNGDIAELIKKFTDSMIVPPPPKLPADEPSVPTPTIPALAAGAIRGGPTPFAAAGSHSRTASGEVGFDPRRASVLPPGVEHPQITKSFSIQSLSAAAAGASPKVGGVRRKQSGLHNRGSRTRKSVVGNEKFVPPPPSTPRPSDETDDAPPPATLDVAPEAALSPSSYASELAAKSVNLEAAAGAPPSRDSQPATPPPSSTATPPISTPRQRPPSLAGLLSLAPPPGPPPAHLLKDAAAAAAAKLQFAAPPPPRVPPPATAKAPILEEVARIPPATVANPIAPSDAPPEQTPPPTTAFADSTSTESPPRAKSRPQSILSSRRATTTAQPPAPTSGAPTAAETKARAHQIVAMLRAAVQGEEDLEIDLELLLDGFGTLERALDESEGKRRELERVVASYGTVISGGQTA